MLNNTIVYFCICGLLSLIRLEYKLKQDDSILKEFEQYIDFTDPKTILYFISLLFGWLFIPFLILNRIYKFLTKKDLINF